MDSKDHKKPEKEETPLELTEENTRDLSFYESIKLGFKVGRQKAVANQKVAQVHAQDGVAVAGPPRMSYTTYNWILFKCFELCVKDFDNKVIDKVESDCASSCVGHLKDSPVIYEQGWQFQGFRPGSGTLP